MSRISQHRPGGFAQRIWMLREGDSPRSLLSVLKSWTDPSGCDASAQAAARQTVKVLRRFARNFPIARPRAALWQGCYYQLAGMSNRAQEAWQKSLQEARQLGMPYETARTLVEMSRHLSTGDPAHFDNLQEVGQIFHRLGMPFSSTILKPARDPDVPSAAVPG